MIHGISVKKIFIGDSCTICEKRYCGLNVVMIFRVYASDMTFKVSNLRKYSPCSMLQTLFSPFTMLFLLGDLSFRKVYFD